jgi:hypothetical protein
MTIQQALRSHADDGVNPQTINEHLRTAAARIDALEQATVYTLSVRIVDQGNMELLFTSKEAHAEALQWVLANTRTVKLLDTSDQPAVATGTQAIDLMAKAVQRAVDRKAWAAYRQFVA